MEPISITIGRDYGSGGREIARLLADTFQCRFYDNEILTLAAKESGYSEKLFEKHDERHGRLHNLLFNKVPIIGHANYYNEQLTQSSLFQFQSEVIWQEAKKGPCIFVGRGADYVLRKKQNVINIFVYADLDFKVAKVMEREQCTADEARRIIQQKEKSRAEYYNFYTGKQWGARQSYHLCINSATLGIPATANIIADFVNAHTKNII